MHKKRATRMGGRPGNQSVTETDDPFVLLIYPKLSKPEHFADIDDVERRAPDVVGLQCAFIDAKPDAGRKLLVLSLQRAIDDAVRIPSMLGPFVSHKGRERRTRKLMLKL